MSRRDTEPSPCMHMLKSNPESRVASKSIQQNRAGKINY